MEGLSGLAYPRLAAHVQGNLPQQVTSFIGREGEIQQIQEMLATARLVTITGPGGCGKTRLVLEAAQRVAGQYPQGAWLVELAALADPAFVEQTVAVTLGLKETSESSWNQVVIDYLRERRLLLVLDNCEHLIDACSRLAGDFATLPTG